MLELKDREWKEFYVGDIFDISKCDYGKDNKYDLTDSTYDIPVVSGQTTNNGVIGYVKRQDVYSKIYRDSLTISTRGQYSGTVLYHEGEFVLNNNIMILCTKDDVSRYVKIFLQVPLNNLGYGGYSNYPKRDELMRRQVYLPITADGQPDYEFMEQYIKEREPDYSWATGCIEPNDEINLQDREWAEFRVDQIFIQERGKEKAPKQNGDGDIPLIVETESNNGVLKNAAPTKVFDGNAITVSINVPKNVFYQEKDFCASVNIAILRNDYINKYSGLFIANLISYANRKYNYGNKQSKDRLNATIISLPVNTDGQPDYEFMEQYIKSLPFSKVLE